MSARLTSRCRRSAAMSSAMYSMLSGRSLSAVRPSPWRDTAITCRFAASARRVPPQLWHRALHANFLLQGLAAGIEDDDVVAASDAGCAAAEEGGCRVAEAERLHEVEAETAAGRTTRDLEEGRYLLEHRRIQC